MPECLQCGRLHSILRWRTGIPKATQCGQKKQNKTKQKPVVCVSHIFLESTVTDGSAGRLSILPNVKRSEDLHSSILLSTGASGVSNRESWYFNCEWLECLSDEGTREATRGSAAHRNVWMSTSWGKSLPACKTAMIPFEVLQTLYTFSPWASCFTSRSPWSCISVGCQVALTPMMFTWHRYTCRYGHRHIECRYVHKYTAISAVLSFTLIVNLLFAGLFGAPSALNILDFRGACVEWLDEGPMRQCILCLGWVWA